MDVNIRGRVIQALTPQSGTSAAGRAWKKQEFVLETFDQYPRKVVFTVFGDKVDQLAPTFVDAMQRSLDVTVSCDIESRAFTGRDGVERWSTEVRPWKIVESASIQTPGYDGQAAPMQQAPIQPAAFAPAAGQYQQPAPAVPQYPVADLQSAPASATDDLPF